MGCENRSWVAMSLRLSKGTVLRDDFPASVAPCARMFLQAVPNSPPL
jgi:hypothetical protein